MTDKYFTPSIEDIRVGYECEVQSVQVDDAGKIINERWAPSILEWYDVQNVMFAYSKSAIYVRVPYLTKEQIEAEGWGIKCYFEGGEHEMCSFIKDKYECRWWGKPDYIEFHNTRTEDDVIYEGQCKDINTFRYICKLLGI